MALVDVVKWDGNAGRLAWKYPGSDQLSTATQLIVNESQEAFLVRGGVYLGPFGGGRHTLSTENVPGLRGLFGLPFGGKSPFSAEVWYVNRITNLDVRWGTPDPIQLEDPVHHIMVPVRAFGQYGIRISDSKRFLLKLVGAVPAFDVETLNQYFRGVFTTRIKTQIAHSIIKQGFSVLQVATQLDALSMDLKQALSGEMADYGVALTQFNIHSISIPEDDPGYVTLKAAKARKAEMNIVGYNYQQERGYDVMQTAAGNEGSAGTVMGAGLGVGMGLGLAPAFGQAFGQIGAQMQARPAAAAADTNDRIRLLRELAALRADGVLTEEEFATEKRRILTN